jgi:hypothetical protein
MSTEADCYLAALLEAAARAQRRPWVAMWSERESQLGFGQRSQPEKRPAGNFQRNA